MIMNDRYSDSMAYLLIESAIRSRRPRKGGETKIVAFKRAAAKAKKTKVNKSRWTILWRNLLG